MEYCKLYHQILHSCYDGNIGVHRDVADKAARDLGFELYSFNETIYYIPPTGETIKLPMKTGELQCRDD